MDKHLGKVKMKRFTAYWRDLQNLGTDLNTGCKIRELTIAACNFGDDYNINGDLYLNIMTH